MIEDVLAGDERPERVYIFLLDGLSNTELKERLEHDRESIPNLARIIDGGVMFRYGVFATFPTITWPSHNALGTGAWCGHHDIVNPTYYLRETRQVVTPQGSVWETEKYLADGVETLYEAIHRERGKWDPATGEGVITASLNEPCGRGALHATLERRMLVDTDRMREVARENKGDTNPRWKEEEQEHVYRYSGTDIQALTQSLMLFDNETQPPPIFTFHEYSLTDAVGHDYGPHHEAMRDALIETDKRIGKILAVMDRRGPLRLDAVRDQRRPRHGADRHRARRRPSAGRDRRGHEGGRHLAADLPDRHGRHGRALRRRSHRHRHRPRERRGRTRRETCRRGRGSERRRAGRASALDRPRPTLSASPAFRSRSARTRRHSSSASSTSGSTRATCGWTGRTSSRTREPVLYASDLGGAEKGQPSRAAGGPSRAGRRRRLRPPDGCEMPPVSLMSTDGELVDVAAVSREGRTVLFFYPRSGRPDEPQIPGWDDIPGARGCTPQSCAFRDHFSDFEALGVRVFGVSAQDTDYQREFAKRTHLPYPLLSDAGFALADALGFRRSRPAGCA